MAERCLAKAAVANVDLLGTSAMRFATASLHALTR